MADAQKIAELLMQTWPARMAQSAARGFMAPGNALASTEPMTSEQMVGPAADIAGLLTLGAGAVPAQANTLRAGMSRLKLSPAEERHFDEMLKPQYGIHDEVPSLVKRGGMLEWAQEHTGPLLNWVDESRSLRGAGERLPPSFYQGSRLYDRMENAPTNFKIAPFGEHQ